MRLLFVHKNFPAQYKHLARHFAHEREHSVAAIGEDRNLATNHLEAGGIRVAAYVAPRLPPSPVDAALRGEEIAVRRAELVRDAAARLRREDFIPDVICAHPGWGEALLLKDVFPESALLCFCEFFFGKRADADFDPEFPASAADDHRIRSKDDVMLHTLDLCDWAVTPTEWQRSQFPEQYHRHISVIFDGVDTATLAPDAAARMRVGQVQLTRANEVITFVNRNLEPYRGFHVFMRALPRLLRERPHAQVVIAGGDEVGYGPPPADGRTWREVLLAEVGADLDRSRVHFLGRVPYETFVTLLQLSSVHVYLTYPFVLSWSMIEAMACGCAVVGSATPPVMEAITDGENGLLVDFFDADQICRAITRVLDHPDRMQAMRIAARRAAVERYDLATVCLPRHVELIERLAARGDS